MGALLVRCFFPCHLFFFFFFLLNPRLILTLFFFTLAILRALATSHSFFQVHTRTNKVSQVLARIVQRVGL